MTQPGLNTLSMPQPGITKPFDPGFKLTAAAAKAAANAVSSTEYKKTMAFLMEDNDKKRIITSARAAVSKANRIIEKSSKDRIAKEEILAARALLLAVQGGSVKAHAIQVRA